MFLTDADTGETADSSKTMADVDTETEKKGMSTDSVKFKTGEWIIVFVHTDTRAQKRL